MIKQGVIFIMTLRSLYALSSKTKRTGTGYEQ